MDKIENNVENYLFTGLLHTYIPGLLHTGAYQLDIIIKHLHRDAETIIRYWSWGVIFQIIYINENNQLMVHWRHLWEWHPVWVTGYMILLYKVQ